MMSSSPFVSQVYTPSVMKVEFDTDFVLNVGILCLMVLSLWILFHCIDDDEEDSHILTSISE